HRRGCTARDPAERAGVGIVFWLQASRSGAAEEHGSEPRAVLRERAHHCASWWCREGTANEVARSRRVVDLSSWYSRPQEELLRLLWLPGLSPVILNPLGLPDLGDGSGRWPTSREPWLFSL